MGGLPKYIKHTENSRTYNFATRHITTSNLPSLPTNIKDGGEPLNPHLHPVDTMQLIATFLVIAQKEEDPKPTISMTTNSQSPLRATMTRAWTKVPMPSVNRLTRIAKANDARDMQVRR
jgi:hypothetical protein